MGRTCGPENDADFRTGLVTRTVVVSAAVLFRAFFSWAPNLGPVSELEFAVREGCMHRKIYGRQGQGH